MRAVFLSGKNNAGRFCAINNFDTTKYDKPHMMFLGSTGSGKTYAGQLMIGRSRMAGAKCFAIARLKARSTGDSVRISADNSSSLQQRELTTLISLIYAFLKMKSHQHSLKAMIPVT